MYTVSFSDGDRQAVQALRHDPSITPSERDRVEMLLLSDAGWSPPRIATHLGACAKTVRLVVTRFAETGVAGIRRKRPGPPSDTAKRERITAVLTALLEQERTWTAAQLAAARSAQGCSL